MLSAAVRLPQVRRSLVRSRDYFQPGEDPLFRAELVRDMCCDGARLLRLGHRDGSLRRRRRLRLRIALGSIRRVRIDEELRADPGRRRRHGLGADDVHRVLAVRPHQHNGLMHLIIYHGRLVLPDILPLVNLHVRVLRLHVGDLHHDERSEHAVCRPRHRRESRRLRQGVVLPLGRRYHLGHGHVVCAPESVQLSTPRLGEDVGANRNSGARLAELRDIQVQLARQRHHELHPYRHQVEHGS
mmetsp:Transcript_96345/g.278113  ORF Transcript_96345/g.278113 Transcript_96345/m.278113 type:complete len:242 (-) Transcript_96345:722-1447(-)